VATSTSGEPLSTGRSTATPIIRSPHAPLHCSRGSAAPGWFQRGRRQPQRGATPNVVLILTDDAGYADTARYGAPDIRTPNIDSLARDGVRLTHFYANAMSCSPTRAGR
jgi:hypothetical protein